MILGHLAYVEGTLLWCVHVFSSIENYYYLSNVWTGKTGKHGNPPLARKQSHYKFKATAVASVITEFLQLLGLGLCYGFRPHIEKNSCLHGAPAYKRVVLGFLCCMHIIHCLPGFKVILQMTEMKLKFNVSSVIFPKKAYLSLSLLSYLGSSDTPLLPVPCWLD